MSGLVILQKDCRTKSLFCPFCRFCLLFKCFVIIKSLNQKAGLAFRLIVMEFGRFTVFFPFIRLADSSRYVSGHVNLLAAAA